MLYFFKWRVSYQRMLLTAGAYQKHINGLKAIASFILLYLFNLVSHVYKERYSQNSSAFNGINANEFIAKLLN